MIITKLMMMAKMTKTIDDDDMMTSKFVGQAIAPNAGECTKMDLSRFK